MSKVTISILGAATLLAGCTLMPKYERPEAPISGSWSNTSAKTNASNVPAAEIDWKEFFDDPRLQRLIALALENNRDLRVAALRVEEFRARYRIERAGLFPGAEGPARYTGERFSGSAHNFLGGTTLTTYIFKQNTAYEIDLFGRIRSLKKEALER